MSQARPIAKRAAAPGATEAAGPRLGLALVVIATAQLMVVLDATIVNVALPHIQHALGFSGSGLEWVVNAYALAFGGLLLLGGRAGDLLGRRKAFVAGLLLFSAASLAGGLATSQTWLLAARAMQGAGAAVGLIAGGLLTTYVSWRWVLFVNVPIGLAAALLAPRVMRESPRQPGRSDLPGAVTGTSGVAALVYGLASAATSPNGVSHWGDAKVVASLAASVVLLIAFAVIETRSQHPLLPIRLLADRNRTGANLIMLCLGAALSGMFFFLTVFMQAVWGYSALKTGVVYLPPAAGTMVSSGIAAQLVSRIGARPLLLAGTSVTGGGMYWLSRISEHGSYAGEVLGPMLLIAAGLGLLFVPVTLVAMSRTPDQESGVAASLRNTGQQVGARSGWQCSGLSPGPSWPTASTLRPPAQRPQPGPVTGRSPAGGDHHDLSPRPGQRILPGLPGHRRSHVARPGHHDHRDPAAGRRPLRGQALTPPRDKVSERTGRQGERPCNHRGRSQSPGRPAGTAATPLTCSGSADTT